MDKKKQIERYQLEKFVSNDKLKLLVYGIDNCETPDFEVNINKRLVSIEHSRLINPQLQQVEQYRDKIIKLAQKRFEEKYADKLYALITFNNIVLDGGKIAEQNYVDEVFNLIEGIYLSNKRFEFKIHSKRHREKVSKIIESFSVDNIQNFSHWQHFGAYLVDWIDMDWLKGIIKRKEQNISKYTKSYDENWLLLVSDFGTKASASRTDFIDFSVVESKFDKIYIHSYMADEVTTVK
ncbi:MAG TPA: hypothetical protein DCQ50_11245 [Chryseobacterium sp.]|nr:hypothetical protein [Chryseobacterium sp.]